MNQPKNNETEAEKRTLTLTRHLAAPPELVYKAWTEPARMIHWFGPAGAVVLKTESDPRVGGSYRVFFLTPDGKENDARGTYLEVELNTKLVFTWFWQTHLERVSLVTVQLTPEAQGTRLNFKHEKLLDETDRDNHLGGWTGVMERLAAYVTASIL